MRPTGAAVILVLLASAAAAGDQGTAAGIQWTAPASWKSQPARFDAAPLVVNEITVVGSRCGRFEPALDLLRRGRIDVSRLLSAEFPLSRAADALATAARPGVRKVLLRPDVRAR